MQLLEVLFLFSIKFHFVKNVFFFRQALSHPLPLEEMKRLQTNPEMKVNPDVLQSLGPYFKSDMEKNQYLRYAGRNNYPDPAAKNRRVLREVYASRALPNIPRHKQAHKVCSADTASSAAERSFADSRCVYFFKSSIV